MSDEIDKLKQCVQRHQEMLRRAEEAFRALDTGYAKLAAENRELRMELARHAAAWACPTTAR